MTGWGENFRQNVSPAILGQLGDNEWRKWTDFFKDNFKKIPKISQYYHFRFFGNNQDVKVKETANDQWMAIPGSTMNQKYNHLKDGRSLEQLQNFDSNLIPKFPKHGLTMTRIKYMERKVLPTCSPFDLDCFGRPLRFGSTLKNSSHSVSSPYPPF